MYVIAQDEGLSVDVQVTLPYLEIVYIIHKSF